MPGKPRKRVFVGLLLAGLLFWLTMGLAVWYLLRFEAFSRLLRLGVVGLVVVGGPVVTVGLAFLVIALLSDRSFPALRSLIRLAIDLLFPIAQALGRLLHIDKERIESSFIEVNNRLVRKHRAPVDPRRVMVLLPHCLQRADCRHKVTMNLANCRRCGKCNIGDLLGLAEEYGVNLMVATGGTQARRLVQQYGPRAIVAVACERELASGIQDVNRLPVLAIPNLRPEGPCRNTRVDLAQVRETILHFLEGG